MEGALQYLAHWEASTPAPLKSYTLVMEHLLKSSTRAVQPLAWSLFYHMRFAAHPVPDAAVFAMMIRACAAGVPQPSAYIPAARAEVVADAERALDLFREMTTHHSIRPNKEVLDSLILTCARRKDHYAEAVRLLQQMLDSDVGDSSPLRPDAYTFNAVLQGCARQGDLFTARWILADMVRQAMQSGAAHGPNEETMANVFWTYALYKPPSREATVPHASSTPASDDEGADGAPEAPVLAEQQVAPTDEAPTFTRAMPATSAAVLVEVRSLMARILADRGGADSSQHPMASVHVTPRVVNAYLSAVLRHLPPASRLPTLLHAAEDDEGVFAQAGVAPNAHTLCMLLEACTTHKHRAYADEVARRVWAQWEAIEASYEPGRAAAEEAPDAKMVSKMWALMIRQHAKEIRIDDALAMLRAFRQKYPPAAEPWRPPTTARSRDIVPIDVPSASLDWTPLPAPPPAMLQALHDLSHAPPSADEKYATLTPWRPKLRFRDLELLHHRCRVLRHVPGMNLVTRIDREYRRQW